MSIYIIRLLRIFVQEAGVVLRKSGGYGNFARDCGWKVTRLFQKESIENLLTENGNVITWGNNNNGQSGDFSEGNLTEAVSAGDYHSLAVKTGGTVIVWGANFRRRLS